MARKKLRFTIGALIVLFAFIFFAVSGFQEGKAYYKTLDELFAMEDRAYGKRLKVAGYVKEGSIERRGRRLSFQLEQNDLTLPVRYAGRSLVPETFRDGAEAVLEGEYHKDGTFEAQKIQTKCASKYETKYGKAGAEAR